MKGPETFVMTVLCMERKEKQSQSQVRPPSFCQASFVKPVLSRAISACMAVARKMTRVKEECSTHKSLLSSSLEEVIRR